MSNIVTGTVSSSRVHPTQLEKRKCKFFSQSGRLKVDVYHEAFDKTGKCLRQIQEIQEYSNESDLTSFILCKRYCKLLLKLNPDIEIPDFSKKTPMDEIYVFQDGNIKIDIRDQLDTLVKVEWNFIHFTFAICYYPESVNFELGFDYMLQNMRLLYEVMTPKTIEFDRINKAHFQERLRKDYDLFEKEISNQNEPHFSNPLALVSTFHDGAAFFHTEHDEEESNRYKSEIEICKAVDDYYCEKLKETNPEIRIDIDRDNQGTTYTAYNGEFIFPIANRRNRKNYSSFLEGFIFTAFCFFPYVCLGNELEFPFFHSSSKD